MIGNVSKKKRMFYFTLAILFIMMSIATSIPQTVSFLNEDVLYENTKEYSGTQVMTSNTEKTGASTFSWDNATVYFLLTDRFQNGNSANDHSYNRGLDKNGKVVTGVDESATFHGGDFVGITEKIEEGYFDELGVNALWISAPYEQIHGYVIGSDASSSFPYYAYHGYYALDYTQTDANFGTKEEFKNLVDTAHEHNIRIVLDVVMNHAGYNTLYDMNQYGFGTLKSGWEDSYYSLKNVNNSTYHGFIDYTSNSSDWAKWWGPDWIRAGIAGYSEGSGGNDLTNCLASMPDFKTETTNTVGIPAILQNKWKMEGRYTTEANELSSYLSSHGKSQTVTNTLSYWLSSWVREYGVDGFRCDTAKHVDLASWKTLKNSCVEALREWKAENPDKALDNLDFWMTGEVWDHGVYKDDYYTSGGFDSIINFNTQGGGLLSKDRVAGIYQSYADTINSDPSFNVLSYISSHDSVLARGNLIYNGSAFLLLPGGVQIFYGDETDRPVDSSAQTNGDHEVRGDMNWSSINEEVLNHWRKVGTFRNNHIAVGAGENASITASNGVGFTRTYNKDGITDQIAACIGASANTQVTLTVSSIWKDGQSVVNAYDGSSCIVENGKVVFNSGKNGTILLQEPDGKPLVNVSGNAKFYGTQKVSFSLLEADYAKVSIDGAKKFIAYNGDEFEIGATAYEGDTVKVTVEAENEKGKVKSTFTFYKAYANEDITDPEETPAIVHVKSYDGTSPYLYAWEGGSTALTSAWPGDKMTEKDAEGYYTMKLNTTGTYGIVLNNGNGVQSTDILNLKGEVWIEITNASFGTKIINGGTDTENKEITIYVKTYTGSAPYLYVWDDNSTAYTGSFPGELLSEKTDEGWYKKTVTAPSSVNCIVSNGSNQSQTSNITGITGETWITITSQDGKSYEIETKEASLSGISLLKQETREIKNMSKEMYTENTWETLYSYVAPADELISKGEEASKEEIEKMISLIQSAKKALVLASPTVNGLNAGSTKINGTAAYEAMVTVTLSNKNYTAVADEITGEWSIDVTSLKKSDQVTVQATLNSLSSATVTYTVGNIEVTPTPTVGPTAEPTTEPTLGPTVTPTTEPTVGPTVEPTTVPTVEPTVVPTEIPEVDQVTIYYATTYSTANIHYKIDSGAWTTVPGIKMDDSDFTGYKVITISLKDSTTLTCCFNNGEGTWDNNNTKDYTLSAGTYTIKDGVVNLGVPNSENDHYATIFYKTIWSTANIHYKIGSEAWTAVPGVAMVDSVFSGYKVYVVDLNTASSMAFCFNNGSGTWDNNSNRNYSISSSGIYTVADGTLISGLPK